MDTWIFLGVLALATFGVLAFYGHAISAWSPPDPRNDIVSPNHFVSMRGTETEIDLGRGWRSTDDPRAAWHVWWIGHSGDLIGLRTSELPPPPSSAWFTPVAGHTLLSPFGVNHFTGMKVLGHFEHRPARGLCEELRSLPNGLDVLCGGTYNKKGFTNEAN